MRKPSWWRTRLDQIRRRLEEHLDQIAAITVRKVSGSRNVPPFDGFTRFAVVTVNYSTTNLLKLLLLTLSEQDDLDRVSDIVIVDNASCDGGREFLRRLAASVPRITLVENNHFLSHARGMRMGLKVLDLKDSTANVILSIDTDVVFLRRNALVELSRVFERGACLAGEMRHGLYVVPEAQASFVAVRRDVYARKDVMPWVNHGAPSYWMQKSIRRAGLQVFDFPSYREGYALHRGRAGVYAAKVFRPHCSYASITNNEPHFMGVPNGEAIWHEVENRLSPQACAEAEDALISLLKPRFE